MLRIIGTAIASTVDVSRSNAYFHSAATAGMHPNRIAWNARGALADLPIVGMYAVDMHVSSGNASDKFVRTSTTVDIANPCQKMIMHAVTHDGANDVPQSAGVNTNSSSIAYIPNHT